MTTTRRSLLIVFLGLLTLFSVSSAHAGLTPTNPAPYQCAFNPTGYFYSRSPLPVGFGDFDHLTLWETPRINEKDQDPGVIAGGRLYLIKTMNRLAPFEFTTVAVDGDSFSFTGSFHQVCMLEEEARKRPNQVVIEGKLVRLKDGNKVAEANVEFLYSATVHGRKQDVDTRYPSGRTELFYATREGNTAAMRKLLRSRANPDWDDAATGATPLIVAIRFLETKQAKTAVDLLLAAKANVNVRDRNGMTALMHAAYAFEDKSGSLVSKLLDARANVDAADYDGTTVLMHIIHGATEEPALIKNVRHVLEAGANANARNALGQTAMSIAEKEESRQIVDLLKAARDRP